MESVRETPLFSEISTVSIKNYHDKIHVDLRPHLAKLLETATAYAPSHAIPSSALGMASEINASSSVIHLSSSNASLKTSSGALTVKAPPLEIIIEHPLDERSLVNLSRLLGEHTPASLSPEEAASLMALLGENQVNHLKIKSTGVRFIFRILEQTFRPLYRLPPQFEHFTGRKEELTVLRERRDTVKVIAPRENLPTEEKHDKGISQIAGTGGIGKSQLANYYARLQFREKNYDWIIWIIGGEDDQRAQHNLSSQFADLGIALGLDVKELKEEALYQLIYQRLAAKGRGLVVIDDAPNYEIVKPFLPERFGHREMDVLITTRNSHTFDSVLTKILLDVFTLHDAKQYIHSLLKETATAADAEVLATTLDRYPLALTQALAYILNNHCSIAEYCQRYTTLRAAKKKYLETPVYEDDPYQLEHQKRKSKFDATMKVVVELSLEQVKAICQTEEAFGSAKTVLLGATYLAPQVPIPKAILAAWMPEDESEREINKALDALRELSLLEESSQISTYRIHQVVQDTLRLEETPEDIQKKLLQWHKIVDSYLASSASKFRSEYEEKHRILEAHLIVLAQYLSRQARSDEFIDAETYLYYASALACEFQGKEKIAKFYNENALKCYVQMPSKIPTKEARLLMNVGTSMMACGDPQAGKALLEEALAIMQAKVEEEHVLKGLCLMNLGNAMRACGDPKGGKVYLEKALPIIKATLGEGAADVSTCLMNIGVTSLECGYPQVGKKYLETALLSLITFLGERHANAGACLANLGRAALECGDPQNGKKYTEAAIPILEAAYQREEATIGMCWMNRGMAALACGENPRSAKGYMEIALPILRVNLGSDSVYVGMCLMNIGAATLASGDPHGAKGYLEKALPIFIGCLGNEENANVTKCLMLLGIVSLQCNDVQEAKRYYEKALPILINCLGENHPDVAKSMVNLGTITSACGDPYGAKGHLEKALPLLKTTLGNKHSDVGACQMALGLALLECGQLELGKRNLKAALPVLEGSVGPNHEYVGRCWVNLSRACLSSGKPQKAIRYLETALKIFKIYFGDNHEEVRGVQELLNEVIQSTARASDNLLGSSGIKRGRDAGREIRRAAGKGTLDELEQQLAYDLTFANEPDPNPGGGNTPLHWAVINKRLEQVGLLLAYIGYTTVKDFQGRSALELAIRDGNAVVIDHFKTALMNHYSVHQEALLPMLVCKCADAGDEAGLKLLIHLKIPVDHADENMGQTALHLAVSRRNENLIKLLLEAGADPFREDFKNTTPLMLAEEKDELLALTILQLTGDKTLYN